MAETLTPKENLCATEALGLKTPEQLAELARMEEDIETPVNLRSVAFTIPTLVSLAEYVSASVKGVTALAAPSPLAILRLCQGLIQMRDNKVLINRKSVV